MPAIVLVVSLDTNIAAQDGWVAVPVSISHIGIAAIGETAVDSNAVFHAEGIVRVGAGLVRPRGHQYLVVGHCP
jgi:hypothetical protein